LGAVPFWVQTDPNQAEPYKDSEPPLARRPYVACVTHGTRTVPYTALIIKGARESTLLGWKIPRAQSNKSEHKR